MLKNIFKTTFRFLQRNVAFTIINIIGLSVGIAAFILIVLYIQNELSYDKNFPDDVQVYRMVGIQEPPGIDVQHVAITSGGWVPFINEHIPGVVDAFRLMHAANIIEIDGEAYREDTFFSEGLVSAYFGHPVIRGGEEALMLSEPNTAMISRETAYRLFGTVDVVGESFRHNNQPYSITGVFDREGNKTHLEFDVLLSLLTVENDSPWFARLGNNSLITYVVLPLHADVSDVEAIINAHYEQERMAAGNGVSGLMKNTFYLQKVSDIYLRSGQVDIQSVSNSGNINSVYVFTLVALLVLAIACINFINLSTANAANRAREVGMRKVLGAGRRQLTIQFISESIILTFVSLVLALLLLEYVIPRFNTLLGTDLYIDFVGNPLFNIGLLLILLVVGLLAGVYPGLFMSRYQPTDVLKSQTQTGKPRAAWLRRALVIFQFAISTALIFSTFIVLHQVQHMQKKDRGYNPNNVLFMRFDESIGFDQLHGFREHLKMLPELTGLGIASNYNGVAGKQSYVRVADSLNTTLMCRYGYVDPDFFPVMEIEIIEGRNFSYDNATDPYQAAIINEAAQKAFGWKQPLGQRVQNDYHEDHDHFTIIGVIRDYNYYSVRVPIQPAIYLFQKDRMSTINIRFGESEGQTALSVVETAHNTFFPSQVFSAGFVEDILLRQTRNEENTMKLFLWSAVMCIVISCLGLFGLTSYTMTQRRKEISIRRVMGASVVRVNLMLAGSFMRIVLLAVAIALPVSFLIMDTWLGQYPYRISIGIIHISAALVLITGIAMATVLFYSTKAARRNPVDNLKYE